MRSVPPIVAAAGITVLALLVPTPGSGAAPAPAADPTADLTAVVTQQLLAQQVSDKPAAPGRRPVVTITREADGWAFGTAVLAGTPGSKEMPYGWLFLAKRSDQAAGGWQLGLEGEAAFAELATAAPEPVASAQERSLFAATATDAGSQQAGAEQAGAEQAGAEQAEPQPAGVQQAGGDYRTGMQWPWSVGAYWVMSGGPHGWGGSELPYSSVDLHGGDQVVRAARGGTAYTMCRGWLRVIHDRGYATDYYHLWNNINVNGAAVSAGTRLGDTGTDVTCGGAASGRHVHFGLRQNSAYVGINNHNLGGWVPIAGAAYGGYALHGSAVGYPGNSLYNFGALGFNQGIIDGNGGTVINKRSGPGTGYGVVGTINDGATVTVSCSAGGTTHTGRWGTTSLWNRLSDGTWVTDAFMWTGVNGPVAGYC